MTTTVIESRDRALLDAFGHGLTLGPRMNGKEPRVRATGTLDALRRLRGRGLVTDREGREVSDAYVLFRRLEHHRTLGQVEKPDERDHAYHEHHRNETNRILFQIKVTHRASGQHSPFVLGTFYSAKDRRTLFSQLTPVSTGGH